MKQCQVCSTKFLPKNAIQKFCSDVCRGVFYGRSPEAIRKALNKNVRDVTEWRRALKLKAIQYKGGSCVVCQYNKCPDVMEFHHLDPEKKDFAIGNKGTTRAWEKVKLELDKCALLCCRCHREVHAGLINVG